MKTVLHYCLKKTFYCSIVSLLILICTPYISSSEESQKEVVAIGMADGTTAKSRDEAVADALRQAVKQAMGSYVSSETLVENMILIEDRIYSETRGYIKSYEVLKENTGQNAYTVEVSAIVKTGKLADDLESIGLLMRKKQNPRVMVILFSKEVSNTFFDIVREGNSQIENRIESSLLQKGFQIVDAGQVGHKKSVEAALFSDDLSGASSIARDFGAEILVAGNVSRTFANRKMLYGRNVEFYSNEINIKALETDTAKVLYSGSKNRPPSALNYLEPMEAMSDELTGDMISSILNQWSRDVYQAGTFQLNLTGATFADVSLLKKNMENIRGINSIQTRNFQAGNALLEVKYKGTLEELADRISQITRPVVQITGLQSNTIDIKVSK